MLKYAICDLFLFQITKEEFDQAFGKI